MHDQDLSTQMIGQYELRELLGEGGMGSVYRAYQVNLKREVAIKVLPAKLAASPGYLERFSREAATAASLEHAHIIPVYDYGSYQNITYIVMRLLTGGTLSQRVAQHQADGHTFLSLGEIAVILHQLASALDYAHSRGVIHRDIKPGNVMFDNHGSAYLVDFGIARLMEVTTHLTATGAMVGTPLYMPPEQWQSEVVTSAADQYSLAVMIYQLATGHTPFETDTPYALMNKHINEQPTPPQAFRSGIPDSVSLVLQRALAKKPGERFPTVTGFAQAFGDAIEGVKDESTQFLRFKFAQSRAAGALPFSTQRVPPHDEAKPFYRSPALWVSGAALAVLLLLGVFFISQQSNAASSEGVSLVTPSPDELAALRQTNAALIAQVATASATPVSPTFVSPTATLVPTDTPTAQSTNTAAMSDTPVPPTFTPTPNRTLTALARTLTRIAVFNDQATANAQGTAQADALAMPTVTLAAAPAFVTVNGASGANLRGGPGQGYPVVETAPQGRRYDVLARIGEGQNLWYLIRSTGRNAWVWSGVIALEPTDAVVEIAATIPPLPGNPPTSTPRPIDEAVSTAQNPTNQPPAGGGQPPATPIPPTPIPPTPVPPTAIPPTPVPPTAIPPTPIPPTPIPPTPFPTFEEPPCPPPPMQCP